MAAEFAINCDSQCFRQFNYGSLQLTSTKWTPFKRVKWNKNPYRRYRCETRLICTSVLYKQFSSVFPFLQGGLRRTYYHYLAGSSDKKKQPRFLSDGGEFKCFIILKESPLWFRVQKKTTLRGSLKALQGWNKSERNITFLSNRFTWGKETVNEPGKIEVIWFTSKTIPLANNLIMVDLKNVQPNNDKRRFSSGICGRYCYVSFS